MVNGMLGYSDNRRIVIVGEGADPALAAYYQKKYNAMVWFTPAKSGFKFGPSYAMQVLVEELKSINQTVGRWDIVVPKIAEDYFLTTLRRMNTNAIAKARGAVVLIDSSGNKAIESEVKRISGGNFFVVYEFQQF